MPSRGSRTRTGIALGLALALASSVGSAVGFSSHPVGEESHPVPPRQKRCFGTPPRQTPDPLSPPCVPFFDGDNGGSTWRGVSGSSVRIAIVNDLGLVGPVALLEDLAAPHRKDAARTIAAQVQYFENRYQTYGRRIDATAFAMGQAITCSTASDLAHTIAARDQFAAIILADDPDGCLVAELAERGVLAVTLEAGLAPRVHDEHRGMIAGWEPDRDEAASLVARFACEALLGRPARFAPDPALAREDRRIEIVTPGAPLDAQQQEAAAAFRTAMERGCGERPTLRSFLDRTWERVGLPDRPRLPILDRDEQEPGPITTYLCVCDVADGELLEAQRAIGEPRHEWLLPLGVAGDASDVLRAGSLEGSAVFGISTRWVLPDLMRRHATRAYREVEPDTMPDPSINHDTYHALLLAFQGVQGAGPDLTPASWERGLRTLVRDELSGELPSGNLRSSDDQPDSFRESALAWWWNESDACIASAASAGSDTALGTAEAWNGRDGVLYRGDCLEEPRA